MHLKKIRKNTAMILVGILSIIPLATSKVHADSSNYNEIKNERAIGDYYTWRAVGSRNVGTETKGGWVHFYTGARARSNEPYKTEIYDAETGKLEDVIYEK